RNRYSRRDYTAEVLTLRIDRVERGGGAEIHYDARRAVLFDGRDRVNDPIGADRSEEHTSELQSPYDLVCRLLLEKKKKQKKHIRLNDTNNLSKKQMIRKHNRLFTLQSATTRTT